MRTVRRILQYGNDVEVVDVDQPTTLHIAIPDGHEDMVRLLLEHEAHIEAFEIGHYTALHHAMARRQYTMRILLLEFGANIEARRVNGSAPLASAALNGWTFAVKLLVNKGLTSMQCVPTGLESCTVVRLVGPWESCRSYFIRTPIRRRSVMTHCPSYIGLYYGMDFHAQQPGCC